MPIIPLIGLSILVHIMVILFVSLFHISPRRRQRKVKRRRRPNEAFGKLIIVIIFGLSFVSAAWMIRLSVLEKHSTITFIGHRFKHYVPIYNIAEAVDPQTPGSDPAENNFVTN